MKNLKKKYLPLTKDQIKRGIIFSSTLIKKDGTELKNHELKEWDVEKINMLKNDSFFSEICNLNIIRE